MKIHLLVTILLAVTFLGCASINRTCHGIPLSRDRERFNHHIQSAFPKGTSLDAATHILETSGLTVERRTHQPDDGLEIIIVHSYIWHRCLRRGKIRWWNVDFVCDHNGVITSSEGNYWTGIPKDANN